MQASNAGSTPPPSPSSSAPSPSSPPPARSQVLVREIGERHRPKLRAHFLALGDEDRLLRFGNTVADHVIEAYVDAIDFARDTVFGVFDDDLDIVGVGHLAFVKGQGDESVAELGVSVLSSQRGRGIGSALFERAAMHCRNTGTATLYMHCLARNTAMMHIAKKAGMEVNYAYGEADAYLTLPPGNPLSLFAEALQGQVADFDYALKRNLQQARRRFGAFWGTTSDSGQP